MASHFIANQYEKAFDSRRLQHWQLPKSYKERPDSYEGFTQIIANDRGHLMEGCPNQRGHPGRVCWDLGHAQEDPWKYHNLHGQKRSSRRGDQDTEDRSRTVHGTRQITKERPETRTKAWRPLLQYTVSSSKANMKTPPPTEIPNDEIRPNNPSPHSPTKLAESSTPEDRPGQEPMVA
ncbi:Protein Flattop-like [Apostichopus japonicus]|uniref:Cilia- and flagella-associated protein 126 n=1 Tax=Stichopus japonicus TaxID=307972 RepID=A0A2G8L1N5_STIJA|nr:Protein Flattop-like [Apostichopus japonicus]